MKLFRRHFMNQIESHCFVVMKTWRVQNLWLILDSCVQTWIPMKCRICELMWRNNHMSNNLQVFSLLYTEFPAKLIRWFTVAIAKYRHRNGWINLMYKRTLHRVFFLHPSNMINKHDDGFRLCVCVFFFPLYYVHCCQ